MNLVKGKKNNVKICRKKVKNVNRLPKLFDFRQIDKHIEHRTIGINYLFIIDSNNRKKL